MQKKFTVELVYSEKANVYYYFLLWHQFLVFKTLHLPAYFLECWARPPVSWCGPILSLTLAPHTWSTPTFEDCKQRQTVLKKKKFESDSSWKLVAIFNRIARTLSNTKLQVNKTELYHISCLLTLLYMQQLNKTIFYLLTKLSCTILSAFWLIKRLHYNFILCSLPFDLTESFSESLITVNVATILQPKGPQILQIGQ